MRRGLRLTGGDEHEAPAPPARDQVRRERLRRMLDSAYEERAQEVPVLERRLLDRRASAPAADEVDEPVHTAVVSLREIVSPGSRRRRIEEVDDVGLDRGLDLGGESIEALAIATADARPRSFLGQPADDRRPEIPGSTCHGDDASFEAETHVATLATLPRCE